MLGSAKLDRIALAANSIMNTPKPSQFTETSLGAPRRGCPRHRHVGKVFYCFIETVVGRFHRLSDSGA